MGGRGGSVSVMMMSNDVYNIMVRINYVEKKNTNTVGYIGIIIIARAAAFVERNLIFFSFFFILKTTFSIPAIVHLQKPALKILEYSI